MSSLKNVYSKCTGCYKDLTEEDKVINMKDDNPNYPVCLDCIKATANDLGKLLNEK